LALVVAAFVAVGCQGGTPTTTVVTITPGKLFTGELERLEPHLGLRTGFVKLSAVGPDVPTEIAFEVWNNGKLARKLGSATDPQIPNEISLSIKEIIGRDGKEKYRLVIGSKIERRKLRWEYLVIPRVSVNSMSSSLTTDVDVPQLTEPAPPHVVEALTQPIELTKDRPVAIWAYVAGRHVGESKLGDTIERVVGRVEWALVVTLALPQGK
jgi:hypothetical protein